MGHALSAALDSFAVGAAVVEPRSHRFTFVNEALAALLGATVEELLALPSALERVVPEDAALAAERFADGGESCFAIRFVHASGEAIAADVSTRSYDLERGGRALALVVRGAGERRHREALESALDDASAALRARDDVLSMASHELRTPLTSLRLHAQALARGLRAQPPDGVRARRSVSEVERHADRLGHLIDRLLDAARIRSGKLTLDYAPVDLALVVRDVAARFGPEAARSGSTIILDGEHNVPGSWDPLRLDQIVTNLVSNALKYGNGSPISVELAANDAHAILAVRDYGPGIPAEEHERIFEPFERASTDARVRGAGLGLWIVKRLAEAHGGSVCVMSAPGHGAQFVVDLPREPPER